MSPAESYLNLLNSVVCSEERLYKGELLVWGTEGKLERFVCSIKFFHIVDRPINEYLHQFVASRNSRSSAALGKLHLVISHCRTDQFSRSFLPAAMPLLNLLPSGVFSGGSWSSFRSAMNLCLLRA